MTAPSSIMKAARERALECAVEIRHTLSVVAKGRPGAAETDVARRRAVYEARSHGLPEQVRRHAERGGPEAIWGETIDFVDVVFFERGLRAARSVCRVISRAGQAIGTGFLISPRLMITNNHVIGSESAARGMLAEFDYERDIEGIPRPVTRFSFQPESMFVTSDEDNLDFTVVALGSRVAGARELSAFGFLPISAARNKHSLGDLVNIVQHPDGRMKEAVVRENRIVSRPKSGTVIHYVADTEPGASGAAVFNVMWNVVALHHWGGPHRELVDEKGVPVPRTVNEGIRASAITLELETRKAALEAPKRALIEEALALGLGPLERSDEGVIEGEGPDPVRQGMAAAGAVLSRDGTATWHVPLAVSVRLGQLPAALRAERPSPAATDSPGGSTAVEPIAERKLELDENYENRGGYDADFLGIAVPMPELSRAQKGIAAKNKERGRGDDPHELAYEHFSVVMNGKRRLAFFTATNIDGANAKDLDRKTGVISDPEGLGGDELDEAAEAAEDWFHERRIEDAEQTPSDFFSGQTAFDASGNRIVDRRSSGHRNRMFQQGHLTRRQDPLWGNDATVIRAHADTFHVTNRAPQVGYFNMGIRKREEAKHPGGTLHWRALEDFVLSNARADKARVTVFTGPIFDDDHDFPWSRGRADMKDFRAPREYWKLVLRVDDGELRATALLADQAPLIDHLPELLELGDAEASRVGFEKVAKYHVSVSHLEDRTGLDFGGAARGADTFVRGRGEAARARRVESLDEIPIGAAAGPRRASRARKAGGRKKTARRRRKTR